MSDYSGSPSDHHNDIQPPKRKADQAGLDGHTKARSVKRRASKACQCCRSRKVRCNVTEHGAPCTNCRLDEVDCIVSESRRKKLVHPFQCSIRRLLDFENKRSCNQSTNRSLSTGKCRHSKLELSPPGLATCSASTRSHSTVPISQPQPLHLHHMIGLG
jgi:hypothetical protein